jgi:hypothetical protein
MLPTTLITASGQYPSAAGIRPHPLGVAGFMDVQLLIGGTLGGSPVHALEVQNSNNDWVSFGNLNTKGSLFCTVYGKAVRLNASTITVFTGTYSLDVKARPQFPSGVTL